MIRMADEPTMWTGIPQRGKPDYFCRQFNVGGFGCKSSGVCRLIRTSLAGVDRRPAGPRSGTQSVERAIAVLECFAGAERSLGRHRDRPRRRTHAEHGAPLAAGADRGRVRGAGADDRALPARDRHRGARAARPGALRLPPRRPVLDDLSARTGESVSLGIRRGHEVVVIERAAGASPLRFDHPAGAELAMHASAMGKVLLAYSAAIVEREVALLATVRPIHRRTITAQTTGDRAEGDLGTRVRHQRRGAPRRGVRGRRPGPARSGVAHAAVGLQGPSVRLTTSAYANSRRS